MLAPPAKLAILSADKVKVKSYRQDVKPQTLIMLVLIKSFILL